MSPAPTQPPQIPQGSVADIQRAIPFSPVGRFSVPIVPVGSAGAQLMPLIRSSVTQSTWLVYGTNPVVCILGHSYVFWASQRAEQRPGGRCLGLHGVDVFWKGIRGLTWPQVLPEVVSLSRTVSAPLILIIHAGGNDLCSFRFAELWTMMRSDLEKFHGFFSELILVWSEIIPRAVWQGARNAEAVERSRRNLNARMTRLVRFRGGFGIRHRQLEGNNSSLMLPDGVHLSDIGLDIFLSDLQDGIEQALLFLGGGRSTV
ncbi:uncharacterized protein ACNLHF_019057 [Anomaloglossus baeobatrachus]